MQDWRNRNPDYYKNQSEEKKEARRAACRDWFKRNKEYYKTGKKESRSRHFAATLFDYTKQRAKKTGVQFTLDLAWVKRKLAPGRCPMTGFPFNTNLLDTYKKKRRHHPFRPSIDRKNPKLGYTKHNSRIVCWAYNQAKYEWDDALMLEMAKGILACQ